MNETQASLGAVDPTSHIDPAPPTPDSLAWTDGAEPPDVVETRRPLPRPLLALLAFVGVGALTLGAFILGAHTQRGDDVAQLKPVIETQTVTETPSAEQFLAYHDDAFTKALTDDAIPVGNMNVAVASAQGYCQYLASGHRTGVAQTDYLRLTYPQLTDEDLGAFMGLAIRAFCPQFGYVFGPGTVNTGPATS